MKTGVRADLMHKFVESRDFSIRKEDIQERFGKKGLKEVMSEIPKEARPTVEMLMYIATKKKLRLGGTYGCLRFRCLVHLCMKDLNERCKKGEEKFIVPYAWWTDAVWMDPVWIIKITNGMLSWVGDLSCEMCDAGPLQDCPFCLTQGEIDDKKFQVDYVVSSG